MDSFENKCVQNSKLIEQLRKNISDIYRPEFDDFFLARWLQARSWDISKAEIMLRAHVDWRRVNSIDAIKSWTDPEGCQKYCPGGFFGHDKAGRPIWYELLGLIDARNILQCVRKKDLIRYRIKTTDFLYTDLFPDLSKKMGQRVHKSIFIFDMNGIGLKHLYKPAIDVYTDLLAQVEANYPETLHCCYIINAPSIFPILYNIIKNFLAPETKAKIRILGNNWKEELLKNIDADQLPVHWGGTATDPDGNEYCRSKICLGGPIPDSYKLKEAAQKVDLSQFTTVSVSRGSVINVEQIVNTPNSLLRWIFWTDNNDIGFSVLRRNDDSNSEQEIVKAGRVNSHFVPEEGCIVCEQTGKYIVRFDNSHSWFTGKKLSYIVEQSEPVTSADIPNSTSF